MRKSVLYYDCFSGISGDMNLGALLDLGVPFTVLQSELDKLGLSGWRLDVGTDSRKGINGTRVEVVLEEAKSSRGGLLRASAKHASGNHEHRTFKDICHLIESSDLPDRTRKIAIDMFTKLAAAEGKIHNTPPEKVHFHEVGAMDSILDMVGAAVCIDYLHPDLVWAGTVELGGGFVNCQHGRLPVPVPAVTELLKDAMIRSGTVPFETTTPTGAAILASLVSEWRNLEGMRIVKTGYGVGHRDTEIPNVLRVFWGAYDESSAPRLPKRPGIPKEIQVFAETGTIPSETPDPVPESRTSGNTVPVASFAEDLVTEAQGMAEIPPAAAPSVLPGNPGIPRLKAGLVECNLDDMSPEAHGFVLDLLMEAGAQDAWLSPIVMKKSRSAVQLSVLCDQDRLREFSELVLINTTTLGVRVSVVDKIILERRSKLYKTRLGDMNVKDGIRDDKVIKRKIEFEDLKRGARKTGLPIHEVERQAWREIDAQDILGTKNVSGRNSGRAKND